MFKNQGANAIVGIIAFAVIGTMLIPHFPRPANAAPQVQQDVPNRTATIGSKRQLVKVIPLSMNDSTLGWETRIQEWVDVVSKQGGEIISAAPCPTSIHAYCVIVYTLPSARVTTPEPDGAPRTSPLSLPQPQPKGIPEW